MPGGERQARIDPGPVSAGPVGRLLFPAELERLDGAYVLAPVASVVTSRPRTPLEGLERAVRRLMMAGLMREVAILRPAPRVTLLTPGPDDLAAMGANR